jgi:hypothetical protein
MLKRYLARVLVTSLTFGTTLGAAMPTPWPSCPPAHASPYSPRVLRRIRATLQLQVLQARRARLAIAESAAQHRLSIAQLLALPDDADVLTQGLNDGRLKHFHALGASTCW